MAEAWTTPDSRSHAMSGTMGTIAVAFSSYKSQFTTTTAGSSLISFAIPPSSSSSNNDKYNVFKPQFPQNFPPESFKFSSSIAPTRARSEPPAIITIDTDVDMEPTALIKRSQSHWNFNNLPADRPSDLTTICPALLEVSEPETESQSESQSQPRAVSPTPTEINDPEPDYLANNLRAMGIKVRDFAYQSASSLDPVKETFDQNEAMAEYEFRITQNPRYYPIQGKTLRRLLDIGWIDMGEVNRRCHSMDLEALEKFDSRPAWPYALRFKGPRAESVPTPQERRIMRDARRTQFMRLDRFRRMSEAAIARQEKEAKEAEIAVNLMRGREKMNMHHKRPLDDAVEDDGEISGDQKRRKMSEGPELQGWSQPCSQKPHKQYPAPLSSYDPELYPDAAGIIESQSQSQPRPVIPPRIDTPPLDEEEEAPPPPNALRRLKRTLSRTQTFTRL